MEPAVVVRIHPGQLLAPLHRAPLLHRGLQPLGWALSLVVLLLFGPPSSLEGQVPIAPERRAPVQEEDSIALLDRAMEAQKRFESTHRRHLPLSRERGLGDCYEYIGSICLWNSEFEWIPAEEDSVLTQARGELLRVLEEAAGILPGDRWILGQRVRYLGDLGRWEEAWALAEGCRGSNDEWCLGLRGYVLHRSGKVVEALEAFSLFLEAMSPEERRDWRDPSAMLDREERSWLRDPPDLGGSAAADRFWTFADPLFLTPGNEGLSEYLARRFAISLYEDAALTMGSPWDRSFEELHLRYGFVAGWERAPPGFRDQSGFGVFQHRHPEARGLLPPFEALEDPSGLPEDVWISGPGPSRSTSAPILAPLLANGSAQTAVLRRGGNLLVVGAYGIPRDTSFLRRRPSSGTLPGSDEMGGAPPALSRPRWEPSVEPFSSDTLAGLFLLGDTDAGAPYAAFGSGGEGVLALQVPPGGYLLSLEQWSPRGRWGARVRHGVRGEAVPEDVPHLSDLFLLEPADRLPESFEGALGRLRTSATVGTGDRVTVGWEVYGLSRQRDPLTFHLSLVRQGGNPIRRAVERIGLFRRDPVLTLSWTEAGPSELGPHFRSLDVDLPELDQGRYLLRLELQMPFRSPVVSNRRISVL